MDCQEGGPGSVGTPFGRPKVAAGDILALGLILVDPSIEQYLLRKCYYRSERTAPVLQRTVVGFPGLPFSLSTPTRTPSNGCGPCGPD